MSVNENGNNTLQQSNSQTSGTNKRSCDDKSSLPDAKRRTLNVNNNTSAPVVWSKLGELRPLGDGNLGCVFGATWQQRPVAIKMVDRMKGKMAALEYEMSIYEALKSQQGIIIPKILLPKVESSSGNMRGFGMQLLTPLPCKFKDWSDEQTEEAVKANEVLRQCGYVQRDNKPSNYGISECGKLMLIDLENVVKLQ